MGWNSSPPPPFPRRLIDRWKARVEEARNEGKRVDRRGVNRINENGARTTRYSTLDVATFRRLVE